MNTITCIKCNVTSLESNYDTTSKRLKSDGTIKYYPRRVCKDCRLKRRREANQKISHTPEFKKKKQLSSLKWRYGISADEYMELAEKQENLCAICGIPPRAKALAVDHNHVTGKVRALLCVECNFGIGWFREDIEVMQKAIEYLKLHEAAMRRPRNVNAPFGLR